MHNREVGDDENGPKQCVTLFSEFFFARYLCFITTM